MEARDKSFAGPIPEIYERYLVPLIFDPNARELAARIAALRPDHVLETAAGTGVLTRAMAEAMPKASITATDLNQPMLDRAMARDTAEGRITWKQADALILPVADATYDVVACQFGVMFFPDKVACHREALRSLRPGGTLVFNVWDELSKNAFPAAVADALAELFPDDPPRFMARIPHGYHEEARIRADLGAAGFSDVSVEPVDLVSRAGSALDVATGFCQGTPIRPEIEARGTPSLQDVTRHVAASVERRFGSGPIEGPIRAFVVQAKA